MTLSSRDSLQIVYNSPNYNFQEANNLLKISAKYEFLKTTKLSCGKQLFNTSSGKFVLIFKVRVIDYFSFSSLIGFILQKLP